MARRHSSFALNFPRKPGRLNSEGKPELQHPKRNS